MTPEHEELSKLYKKSVDSLHEFFEILRLQEESLGAARDCLHDMLTLVKERLATNEHYKQKELSANLVRRCPER